MKERNFPTSSCRYCRFYESEGRRGGSCQILGVPVQSSWKACDFASPPFETTLKKLEDIFQLDLIVPDCPERIVSKLADNSTKEDRSPMAAPQIE